MHKLATPIIFDNVDAIVVSRRRPSLETITVNGLGFARHHINPKKSGLHKTNVCVCHVMS